MLMQIRFNLIQLLDFLKKILIFRTKEIICGLAFHYCDSLPNERLILTGDFKDSSPWPLGSIFLSLQ